mgnify:CR=1 FL=1
MCFKQRRRRKKGQYMVEKRMETQWQIGAKSSLPVASLCSLCAYVFQTAPQAQKDQYMVEKRYGNT